MTSQCSDTTEARNVSLTARSSLELRKESEQRSLAPSQRWASTSPDAARGALQPLSQNDGWRLRAPCSCPACGCRCWMVDAARAAHDR